MNQAMDPGTFKMDIRGVASVKCLRKTINSPNSQVPPPGPNPGNGQKVGRGSGGRLSAEGWLAHGPGSPPLLEPHCEGVVSAGRRLRQLRPALYLGGVGGRLLSVISQALGAPSKPQNTSSTCLSVPAVF